MQRRTLFQRTALTLGFVLASSSPLAFAQSAHTIEVSLDTGPNHVRNLSMEALAKKINEASNGQVQLKIFHGASKYKGANVPMALAQGALDMGLPGTWQMGKAVPDFNVTALPMFYGVGYKDQYAVWDGPAGQALNAKLEAKLGVKVIGRWVNLGFAQMFFTDKQVRTHKDLPGLKMRAPGGAANLARFKEFDATAVAITFADVPQALQRRTVDGVLTTHESVRSSKLWDSGLRYCYEDFQTLFQYVPVMSKRAWDDLGAEGQKTLTTLWEQAVDQTRDLAVQRQQDAKKEGATHGIETITASETDLKAMRERLMRDQAELIKELRIDPAIVKLAETTLAARR